MRVPGGLEWNRLVVWKRDVSMGDRMWKNGQLNVDECVGEYLD